MKHVLLGLRDYLPNDIQKRDQLIQKMSSVVMNNNYERIITPSIEQFDLVKSGLGTLSDECIMFFDASGSQLVLRPDHTTAISRIVSSRLSDSLPVKLFYHDSVFRKDPLLGETEIFQFGFEHIGPLTIDDELQMIRMVSSICDAVGLTDYEIHLAHPEIFKSFDSSYLDALKEGDLVAFGSLPQLGKKELAKDYDYCRQLYDRIDAFDLSHVYLNLGLYKDLNYYNGVYFDVVSKSFGKVLGSGGRYDTVLSSFNLNTNAFGFAFRLHYLEKALNQQ